MDEAALIHDAQQGDLEAFNRLVLEYQGRVFNLTYRVMGDPALASDATQEAFISAFRGIKKFRGGSFQSWLLRIATNACYDQLRKQKRRPAVSLDDLTAEGDLDLEPVDAGWSTTQLNPESELERDELRRAIEECLRQLPDDFRVITVLVDVQGYNYGEAAEVIRKPVGTVKSRLARARERLRECLSNHAELFPSIERLEGEKIS